MWIILWLRLHYSEKHGKPRHALYKFVINYQCVLNALDNDITLKQCFCFKYTHIICINDTSITLCCVVRCNLMQSVTILSVYVYACNVHIPVRIMDVKLCIPHHYLTIYCCVTSSDEQSRHVVRFIVNQYIPSLGVLVLFSWSKLVLPFLVNSVRVMKLYLQCLSADTVYWT